MIKTIFVPASGSDKDHAVFQTALAAARPYRAHLAFFNLRMSSGEFLSLSSHFSFSRGRGVQDALQNAQRESECRTTDAKAHFIDFCRGHEILVTDAPTASDVVSASWDEDRSDDGAGEKAFITRSRYHDLIVMGRFTEPDGLPSNLIELLLVASGRPILIASLAPPRSFSGTVMVCWKNAREPALALTASMPLLINAKRVVVVSVDEDRSSANDLTGIVRQLGWHGIRAEAQLIAADGRSIATLLSSSAEACDANLLVMGSFSTGPLRQAIFGGCTQSILKHADIPVLMVH